ncbi:MAG: trypsin-like serine protease [Anaerolineales bacterium]|nr:trypsin-like serine protease [Anaerolineales bacterium]
MNTVRRFAFLVIALALLCSSIPAVYAQDEPSAGHIVYMPAINATTSSQGGDAGQVVTKIITPAEQQAALDFWTRDAIAKAQPLAMPMQMGAPTVDEMATSAVLGPPGFSSPGLADPEAMKVLQAAYPEDWAALNKEEALIGPEAVEGTSQIYTSYIVNYLSTMQKIYPHIWVGRLSFKTSGGTSYCSGTSISNNIMLTAAHCVYDSTNNVWYSNWALTPAYRNGNALYGTFPATQCYVLGAYQSLTGSYAINTWARHDVAVCKMGKNSAARRSTAQSAGWGVNGTTRMHGTSMTLAIHSTTTTMSR